MFTCGPAFFAGAAASGPPDPGVDQYYVEITIASGEVASDLTDYPVYVDLSGMPAGFWSHVNSDGGDIRVMATDGTTSIPMDLVWIDYDAQEGSLFFKRTVASGSDTVVRVYYGATGLDRLPATDTYGRNAVWSDYDVVVIPGEDLFNRTGKSAPRAWGYPQTFELVSTSASVTGHEGVIGDGSTYVVIGSNALRKYNAALDTVLASNLDPSGDTGTAASGCGGGCYYDGKIYVTVGAPQQIAVFDYATLAFIESFDISATGAGIGGLEVCPLDDAYIYGIPFVNTSPGSDKLLKYNRTTGAHVETITMSAPIRSAQGIVWYGNAFFVPDGFFGRYTRVELDGTHTVGGLFATSGTIEDGFKDGGDFVGLRVTSGEVAVVDRWRPFRTGLGSGGANFTSDARLTAPVTTPGNTWSIGVSLSRNDTTTRVALALTTASSTVVNVAYTGGTIRPAYDASNGALNYGSSISPDVGVMSRVNVVYDSTTERRAYHNGGSKVTDATITAKGSTFAQLVYGSDQPDSYSFGWRGFVGLAYLRMSALSDDWIAAEYSNLSAPGSFYTIGAEQSA